MSKRKVQFAEKADDVLEQAFEEVDTTKKRRLPERESRFKEKHSLDSDEEDIPEKYNVLDEEEIEGVTLFTLIDIMDLIYNDTIALSSRVLSLY